MNNISQIERLKNILSFLIILFGEDFYLSDKIFEMAPEYIIEKFEKYVLSNQADYQYGIHPLLKKCFFDKYCEKWKITNVKEY